ncbi:MAG: hypothetical protein E7099_02030 [Mediterranea massiliensis]|nr:hypothetical protein [Mediterranea massiliensis]
MLYICTSREEGKGHANLKGQSGTRFASRSYLVRFSFGSASVVVRCFFGPIESEQTPNNDRRTTEQRAHEKRPRSDEGGLNRTDAAHGRWRGRLGERDANSCHVCIVICCSSCGGGKQSNGKQGEENGVERIELLSVTVPEECIQVYENSYCRPISAQIDGVNCIWERGFEVNF